MRVDRVCIQSIHPREYTRGNLRINAQQEFSNDTDSAVCKALNLNMTALFFFEKFFIKLHWLGSRWLDWGFHLVRKGRQHQSQIQEGLTQKARSSLPHKARGVSGRPTWVRMPKVYRSKIVILSSRIGFNFLLFDHKSHLEKKLKDLKDFQLNSDESFQLNNKVELERSSVNRREFTRNVYKEYANERPSKFNLKHLQTGEKTIKKASIDFDCSLFWFLI